jgi:DNA-binding PadR family transcriptional regulator
MAKRRKVDNLLALAVLSYLSQRPMHPYELGRTLRDQGDERSIKFNHGSLYMVVQQLARAGFIAELESTREGNRPERTVYQLTDAGRQEMRDWLRDLVETPRHEYPHFVAALSLIGALPPSEVVSLLGRRLTRLAELHAEARSVIDTSLAANVHPLFLVEEDYRVAMLDAESAFVTQFIGRITSPDSGWGTLWADFHGESPSTEQPAIPPPATESPDRSEERQES